MNTGFKDKVKKVAINAIKLYTDNRIPMAAAALSYYLTMTFFPIVICLYTMLGSSYEKATRALSYFKPVFPEKTFSAIESFLEYVSANNSVLMMIFAISVILMTSSASFRSIENTIGRMQGGNRYDGYAFFIFSVVLSVVFVAMLYLAIIAIFFGENIVSSISKFLPSLHLERFRLNFRYLLLFGLSLVMQILIYNSFKRKEDKYKTLPGAILSTLAFVGITAFFSLIINSSIKYNLIYSSLASVIILMFWLYCCCMAIYCGALFNIALRDAAIEENVEALEYE